MPQTLRILGDSAFRSCKSLKAVSIPANVETLATRCFSDCGSLVSVTFEYGSKLAVIEVQALERCHSLASFHIPSSLASIHGSAFEGAGVYEITIDSDNRHFSVCRRYLLDFEGVSIILYLGGGDEVTIPKRIRRLCCCCFWSGWFSDVIFEPTAELLVIEENAFHGSRLHTISIPKSVTSLMSRCFSQCDHLNFLSFEADSNLCHAESDILEGSVRPLWITIPENLLGLFQRSLRDELKRGIVKIGCE
jgi:hypothetical protein